MSSLFETIELTPKEIDLYEALRIVEPAICRIAPQRAYSGEFKVLLEGAEKPIPLKRLQGGVWYMLNLALGLVNAAGGVLMVDDIDVGLCGKMMNDLWPLILEMAHKLDIQVFATTHNQECWQSLADLATHRDINGHDIRIHHIQKGGSQSMALDHRKLAG